MLERKLTIILLGIMLGLSSFSVNLDQHKAWATDPTVGIASQTGSAAGSSTTTTQIEVTFATPINATTAITTAAWSVTGFTIASVDTLPTVNCQGGGGDTNLIITLTTALATDQVPQVTYDGTGPNISIRSCDTNTPLVNGTVISTTDGLSPTMDSATTTSTTTIDVTFSENINSGTVSNADFTLDLGLSVSGTPSVSGSVVTITTTTAFNEGDTPAVTLTGAAGGVADTSGNILASAGPITSTDGLKPTVTVTTNPTSPSFEDIITTTFTWSESVTTFVVGDVSVSAGTLSGFSGSGASYTVVWDLSGQADATHTITVAQDSAIDGATNTGPASAVVTNFVRDSTLDPAAGQGSGCDGDCNQPTLGINHEGRRLVENGFTYNGKSTDVESFYTPYPLITVNVGQQNKAVFKIYENLGPNNIRHFDLAFGLASGQIMGTSNAMIQWDKSFDGIETVTLVDPHNVLDNVRVDTTEGKCRADSNTNDCLIVTVYHIFRAPLESDIVATNVWDQRRNAWQNYFNHGVNVEGESLNPAKTVMAHIGNTRADAGLKQLTQIDRFADTWTDEVGNIYHYNGNHWFTLIQAVEKEFIPDGTTSHGFDRYSNLFSFAIEKQRSIAGDVMCVIDHRLCDNIEFEEIDNIFAYEYPTVQKDRLAGTLLNSHS